MKNNQGKVTTTKSQFIALGKGVKSASGGVVLAWLAVYREFVKNGGGNEDAFAQAFVRAQRGTPNDIWKASTVRQSINKIRWAEENIKGGAKACPSMSHIDTSRKRPVEAKPAGKAHKVSTVTVTDAEFAKALRKAGLSAEVIAIAQKALFITK